MADAEDDWGLRAEGGVYSEEAGEGGGERFFGEEVDLGEVCVEGEDDL